MNCLSSYDKKHTMVRRELMKLNRQARLPKAVHKGVRHIPATTVIRPPGFSDPGRSPRTIGLNGLFKVAERF